MGGEGITQDFEKAAFYFERSAQTTNLVEAYLGIARLCYLGRGVERDWDRAFNVYTTIANESQNPIAWIVLGRMYLEGHGVKKDLEKAKEYLDKAAPGGYVFAYAYRALLEKEKGQLTKAWFTKLKTVFLAMKIKLKNNDDIRLRSS